MAMRRNRHYYSSGHFLQVKSWLSSKIAPRWYSCSDSIGVHHFYPAAAMFWKVFLVLLALGIRVAVHGTSSGRSQHLSPVVPSVREGKLGTIRRLSQSLLGRIANIRAGAGSRVKEPNSVAEFDKILQRALKSQLVVVDFTASWCGPCKMIAPIYKEFAEQYSKAVFVKVCDNNSHACDSV